MAVGHSVCFGVWGRASAGEVSPTGRGTVWRRRVGGCPEDSVSLEGTRPCSVGPRQAGQVARAVLEGWSESAALGADGWAPGLGAGCWSGVWV